MRETGNVKKTVKIRNVEIGAGMPKVCVSVMGINEAKIIEMAGKLKQYPVDIVEWRADCLDNISGREQLCSILEGLRAVIGDMPLLFTFRSKREGGNRELPLADYVQLLSWVGTCHNADMVDVEMFFGAKAGEGKLPGACFQINPQIKEVVRELGCHGKTVVGSYHDFTGTPETEEIVGRLAYMAENHADIPKIALMPENAMDVCRLLKAGFLAKEKLEKPMITMSMGKLGKVSRLAGEYFGSAVTFGCVGKASAPGQIEAEKLKDMMECLHS